MLLCESLEAEKSHFSVVLVLRAWVLHKGNKTTHAGTEGPAQRKPLLAALNTGQSQPV